MAGCPVRRVAHAVSGMGSMRHVPRAVDGAREQPVLAVQLARAERSDFGQGSDEPQAPKSQQKALPERAGHAGYDKHR